jgi:hypothetical protein
MSYSTAYPSARALSRIRPSRVTMVTNGGGSPSSSAVARWTASGVRIGSMGNGRTTRASTVSGTPTTKHRRAKTRSPRTAARSCAGARRPLVRARTIARPASASVSADVTCRPLACSACRTPTSPSRSAARRALDSMYRMAVTAASAGRRGPARGRAGRPGRRLRFATIALDQFGSGSARQPDVRPLFQRVAGLDGRANHPLGNELVESASTARSRCRARGNKLGDHAAMSRDGHSLARFDASYVATEVVLQFADARRGHILIIATCSHIHKLADMTPERHVDEEQGAGCPVD